MTYIEFIQNIIETRGQWNIPEGEYFEAHHIKPKCLGGEGKIRKGRQYQKHENIIFLYAREHFIAHKLLAEENQDNYSLVQAWNMMAFPKGKTKRDFEILPEEYEELRKLCSEQMSLHNPALDKNGHPWNFGKTKETDGRLALVSKKAKGKNTWVTGITRSEQTKEKMSIAVKKRYTEHPETFVGWNKDKVAITDGKVCYYISKDTPLPDGFTYGQGKRKHYTITNPEALHELRRSQNKGEKNPMYGKGEKISGGKNGHAIYIYTYKGKDYGCRDALIIELKKEFPDVSESAIRKIMQNNYGKRIINKFKPIIDNLTWRLKHEN